MEFPNHQHHFRPHHGRSHAPPPPPSSLSGPPAPPPSVFLPHHLSHPHPHAQPPPPHPSLLLPLPLLNRQALLSHPSHAQPHPHAHAHAHMRPRKRPASDPLADPKRRGPLPPNQVAVGAALIPLIDLDSVRSRPPPADTLNPETRPIVNSRVDFDIAQSRANLAANLAPDRKPDSRTMPNTRVNLDIAQSRVNLAANLAPDRKPESRTMLNARANLDVAQSRVNLAANSGPDRKPEIRMMPNSRADLDIGQSRVNLAVNSDPDIKPESRTMVNARVDLGTGLALDRKPESRAMANTRIDLDLGQPRANLAANSALERKPESRAMVDSRIDLDIGQSRVNLGANLASDRKLEGRMMVNSRVNPGVSLALDRKLEGTAMLISRGDLETGSSRADSGGGASLGLDRKLEGRGMAISRAEYETGSSRIDPSLGLDRKFENRVTKLSRVDASTGLTSDRKLESRVMAERDEDRGRDSSRSMPADFSLASKKLRSAPDREEESSMGSSLGTGDKPKKKERPMDGLVFQYKTALGELTFNSKPIITNLTIIAGENQQHASKGIATTICSHILEVPNEQKLPTLYLLDSIVKNISGDYVKHFAARLPEVFCKSYRQVDPATHPSMQHLFKTWKGVFPSGTLREIEKELEFPSQGQTPSSNANATRSSESPSRRPGNSIHVNPKYVEAQRQRMQQSNKLVSQNEKEDNLSAEKIPTKKVSAHFSDYDYGSNNDPGPDVASSGMAAADQDEGWERGGSLRESDDGYNRCAETSSGLGYSQCNGYEQRPPSPKALVDAYGNPRGPRVPRLLPPSVLPHEVENRSRAPPRNWQSSEGYVWEEMSPKLLEHTRFRDASRKEEWFPGGDNDRNVVPGGGLDRNMIDGVGWRRQGPPLASVERPSSAESRPSMHPLHPAVSEERSHSGLLQSSLSLGQVAFSRHRLPPTDLPSPILNSVSTSGNGMHTSAHPADAFFGGESSLSAMPAIDGGNFQPRRMLPQRPPSPAFPPASQLQRPLSPPSFMPVEHSSRPLQNNTVEPGQHIGQPPPPFSQSSPTPPFLPGPVLPSQPTQGEQSIGLSLQSLPQLPPHVLQSLRQLQQHLPSVSGMPVPPSQSATSAHPRSSDSSSSLPLPQTTPGQLFQNQHFLQLPAPKAESSQTQAADSVESGSLPLSAFIPRGGGDGISQPGPPSPSPLTTVSSIPSESNPTQISSQLPPLPSGPPPLPLAALNANQPMLLSQGALHPPPQPFAPVPLPPPVRHSSQLNSTLQPPLPPGPPPASSQVVTPLPLQPPASGVSPPPAINNLSSLLSSLISQGLISSSTSSAAPLPPQPSQTDISGGGVSGGASMSVSSIPMAQQTSAMAAVSEAPQPNATLVSDDIGTEFKQDILRVRHESVVNSLYGDMPSQCKSCGFRFKCQEEHSKHMDWHACRNRRQKTSRRWFVSAKEWLGGMGASSALEATPSFFADEAAPATEEEEIIAVVADENQSACALCGEPFEDFYSDEMEEWMYRGAVYMNAPRGKTEGATEDTSQLGPIVHAKCRSESAAADPVNAEDRVRIS